MIQRKIVLTGDRPSGALHLGHYVGSLASRLKYQEDRSYNQYIMIADVQALTDYYENPKKVVASIFDVMLDYLAIGLDPEKNTIFLQSSIPEIAELTIYYLNLVTVSRLERNPTTKYEIQQKKYDESIPAGFLCYPVSQAADITAFKAQYIPVGADQLPHIEQTNEIVRRFNRLYKTDCLQEAEAVLTEAPKLVGIDGQKKASKSIGNAILLSDTAGEIKRKVFSMFTDPNHLKVEDSGEVEGNVVFQYLDLFHPDKAELEDLKQHYRRGGLGDTKIKSILNDILQKFLAPIREKRLEYANQKKKVMDALYDGTLKAQKDASITLQDVKDAMGIGGIFSVS